MKIIVLVFGLLFSINCYATRCAYQTPKPGDEILIEKNERNPSWNFSAPSKVDGIALHKMYLRAYRFGSEGKATEMLVSIDYDIEGELAKSGLWLMPEFIKIRIEAQYGKAQCGPRLLKDLEI